MKKAKELFDTTMFNVTEVSIELGYAYSSAFSIAFKRTFGITPLSYMNAVRKAQFEKWDTDQIIPNADD